MSKGRILLLVPPYLTTDALVAALYPQPLGLVSVGTVLEHAGYDVTLQDFTLPAESSAVPTPASFAGKGAHPPYRLYGVPLEQVEFFLAHTHDDFDAVGLYSGQCNIALGGGQAVAQMVHDLGLPLVVGGPFATTAPAECHELFQPDVLVVGEGEGVAEKAFEYALAGAHGKTLYGASPAMDELLAPDWDLAPPRIYPKVDGRIRGVLQVSRGCPHGCSFCSVHTVQGRRHRRLDTGGIYARLTDLADHGVRYFCFLDDNLFISKDAADQVLEACGAIRDLYPKARFYVEEGIEVRVAAHPGLLASLVAAGFDNLGLGLESVNEHARSLAHKPYTKEHLAAAVREVGSAGLAARAFYIIGLPGDTLQSVAHDIVRFGTLGLAARPNNLKLYPGTAVHHQYLDAGLVDADYDWRLSSWHTPDQPGLSYAQVRRLKAVLGAIGKMAEDHRIRLCADSYERIQAQFWADHYMLEGSLDTGLMLVAPHAYFRPTPYKHALGLLLLRMGAPGYKVEQDAPDVLRAQATMLGGDEMQDALVEALTASGARLGP